MNQKQLYPLNRRHMLKDELPDQQLSNKATLIVVGISIALMLALLCIMCTSCSPTALKFWEHEAELLNQEIIKEMET
jgi:hypothetical protein